MNRLRIEMLNEWLDLCPNPTWEMVAHALDGAGAIKEARSVREEFCGENDNKGKFIIGVTIRN